MALQLITAMLLELNFLFFIFCWVTQGFYGHLGFYSCVVETPHDICIDILLMTFGVKIKTKFNSWWIVHLSIKSRKNKISFTFQITCTQCVVQYFCLAWNLTRVVFVPALATLLYLNLNRCNLPDDGCESFSSKLHLA